MENIYLINNIDNKGVLLIKTSTKLEDINNRNTLINVLEQLYEKNIIDLDKKEDLEFGYLSIPRQDELEFISKFMKIIEL